MDCLTDDQLDAYGASDPDPDTAAERRAAARWNRVFGRGCLARSGELARHITTIEAARDMDVLRAALGERTLTILRSYGTELGATYADLFPAKVGRMVLDGAVDLSIGTREQGLEQAAGFETALRAYVTNCVEKSSSCFLGDSVDEGLARIKQFLDEVDARPLPTGTDRALEVGNAFTGIALPLYSRDYWFVLSEALQQAFDGDGSTLLKLSDTLLLARRGRLHRQPGRGELRDQLPRRPVVDPRVAGAGQIPAFERASPTFGRVFAWTLTSCSAYGGGPPAAPPRHGRRSAPDRRHRHQPRPGHPDEVGRGPRRSDVRRADPPGRRRAHRLQQRQRLRRRSRRGLPRRRHRPRRWALLLTCHFWLT